MRNIFEEAKSYTVYGISSEMACTFVSRFTVTAFMPNAIDESRRDVIVRPQGKRKLAMYKALKRSYQSAPAEEFKHAVFEGLEQPFKADTETDRFSGNACYNFVGEVDAIRSWIDAKQLNPAFDRSCVVAITSKGERVVYPELINVGHACIMSILAETAKDELKERAI